MIGFGGVVGFGRLIGFVGLIGFGGLFPFPATFLRFHEIFLLELFLGFNHFTRNGVRNGLRFWIWKAADRFLFRLTSTQRPKNQFGNGIAKTALEQLLNRLGNRLGIDTGLGTGTGQNAAPPAMAPIRLGGEVTDFDPLVTQFLEKPFAHPLKTPAGGGTSGTPAAGLGQRGT